MTSGSFAQGFLVGLGIGVALLVVGMLGRAL